LKGHGGKKNLGERSEHGLFFVKLLPFRLLEPCTERRKTSLSLLNNQPLTGICFVGGFLCAYYLPTAPS